MPKSYLQQSWYQSKFTMLDRKSSFMTGVARNITQNILQKSRIHSSISNDIEKQLTLIHKCPTLPASKLFHGFLMSAQRAPHGIKNIVKQNRLELYILINWRYHALGLCRQRNFVTFSEVKYLGIQILTIHYYNAVIYPVVVHGGEYTLL